MSTESGVKRVIKLNKPYWALLFIRTQGTLIVVHRFVSSFIQVQVWSARPTNLEASMSPRQPIEPVGYRRWSGGRIGNLMCRLRDDSALPRVVQEVELQDTRGQHPIPASTSRAVILPPYRANANYQCEGHDDSGQRNSGL